MRAIFLDRDGTLVKDYSDDEWRKIYELELYEDTIPALNRIPKSFSLFIVTNQYLIGECSITLDRFKKMHTEFIKTLSGAGIKIEQTYFCPHPRTMACGCRKPEKGMIDQCLLNYPVDLAKSYFIGDSESDILLGNSIGCTTIGVKSYKGRIIPDFIAEDLNEAVGYMV